MKDKGFKLDSKQLELVHKHILDMLIEFDRVCNENNIKYVIVGGTLLGAVRNGGFIPWDDDADIAMTREEYDKFRKIASKLDQSICFFQDNKSDSNYLWGYGKLRKTGTELVRAGQEHIGEKTGVFIDVFPMDDIPKLVPLQIVNYYHFAFWRKVLWAKVAVADKSLNVFQKLIYACLSRIPKERVYKSVDQMAKKSRNNKKCHVHPWMMPLWSDTNRFGMKTSWKYGMDKNWFLKRKRIDFEGHKLWAPEDADGFLGYNWAGYMAPPPEDKRVPQLELSKIKL